MNPRKCWWYEANGRPRVQNNGTIGCKNPNCMFVHPEDAIWSTSLNSFAPKPHLLAKDQTLPPTLLAGSSSITGTSIVGPSADRRQKFVPIGPSSALNARYNSPVSLKPRIRIRTPPPPSPPLRTEPRVFFEISRDVDMKPPPSPRSSPTISMAKMFPPSEPNKELSAEEKLEVWVDRVKLLSDVVTARIDHLKLEREADILGRILRSSDYENTKDDRSRLSSQLAGVETQRDQKKKELNDMVYRLRDMDFWPALPRPEGTLLTEEKQLEIRKTLDDLKRDVRELRETTKQLGETQSAPPPPPQHSGSPPLKRRRLSTGEEAQPKAKPPPVDDTDAHVAAAELEDKFTALEGRVSDLENSMFENQNTLYEEFEHRMSERLEGHSILQAKDPTPMPPPPPPDPHPGLDEKLKTITANLDVAGSEIGEIAEEIAELIMRANACEREVAQLRSENETMKQRIAQLEEVQKQCLEAAENDRAQLRALNAATTAFITQPPQAASPRQELVNDILRHVRTEIQGLIQKDIIPLMQAQHKTVQDITQARSEELSQTVTAKLGIAMQAVGTIETWMDKIKREGGNIHVNGTTNHS